jgi:putative hemolysin
MSGRPFDRLKCAHFPHLMQDSFFELTIILVLVLIQGAFSLAEIAIVSSRKSRLQHWANEGSVRAAKALELANNPRRFLATVQVGMTLVSTLAGAYGGATLAAKVSEFLGTISWVAAYRDGLGLGIVVLGMTYLQIMLGELAPKALALSDSEQMAMRVAVPLHWLSRVSAPVVVVLDRTTGLLLKILGSKASVESSVTHEEIGVMVAQGARDGVFAESQQDMMESVIEMHERRISTLMTPRPDIVWLEVDDDRNRLAEILAEHPHSRLPVCKGGLDKILGVVHMKDLLSDFMSGKPLDFEGRAQKPLTIPETISVIKALESIRASSSHMAFVIDEYGSLQGIVTLKDILESIVGDLPNQGDDEPEMVEREDGSWLMDGTTGIDDIKELLRVEKLEGEEENAFQTLGGFIMLRLGRIPQTGDHFHSNGFRYEVVDMDRNRVDKVLVSEEVPPEAVATTLLPISPENDSEKG